MHQTLTHIRKHPIIPVYYNQDVQVCLDVLKACYEGGIRVFEFTDRGENALENFKALWQLRQERFPDLSLGIGTIKTPSRAQEYLNRGADFIVSPVVEPSIAECTLKNDVLWIPGCMTPTEIHLAEQAGAPLVKLFPGQLLGPAFLKAIKPLFPDMHFMPTGGVEPARESLQAWFNAGVYAAGLGSKLFQVPENTTKGDYQWLSSRCRQVLDFL